MGWLEITYFCKIRCFKRVPLAAESPEYQGVFSLFLEGEGEDEKGELLQNWKTLLSSGNL